MSWMPEAIRDGIIVVLVISGPLVLAAAFIGLVIGVLQAATQVQEQTIGSALKIIGIFALIIFAGFWMYQYLNQYTSRTISRAFTIVPHLSQKVIPRGVEGKNNDKEKAGEHFLGVEPPEKPETQIPENGFPPGAPYLGRPSLPQIPAEITHSLPPLPAMVSTMETNSFPNINLQEPIALPAMQMNEDIYDSTLNNDNANNEEEFPELNLVPGEEDLDIGEINPDLFERNEEVTKKNEDNNNQKGGEELPTWID